MEQGTKVYVVVVFVTVTGGESVGGSVSLVGGGGGGGKGVFGQPLTQDVKVSVFVVDVVTVRITPLEDSVIVVGHTVVVV